jgi:hypothetical protein
MCTYIKAAILSIFQDALQIAVIGVVFVFLAFFSFFVHMLVAVFFPVLAGLVLGFWVYMWRNVWEHFCYLGGEPPQHEVRLYSKLPAAAGSGRSLRQQGI